MLALLKRILGFSSNPEKKVMNATIKKVSAVDLVQWLKDGSAVVVDVREAQEHQAGHIPGAVLVPLSSFNPAKVPDSTGKHLVFHCQMGRRCGPASDMMAASGFSGEIYRLDGGFNAWVQAGGAVKR